MKPSVIIDFSNLTLKQALDSYSQYVNQFNSSSTSKKEILKYFDVVYKPAKPVPQKLVNVLPKSYTDFINEHGVFQIRQAASEELIKIYQPNKMASAYKIVLAWQLESKRFDDAAEELGLDVEILRELDKILIFFDSDPNADWIGFDTRTKNPETTEMNTAFVTEDDGEYEYIANLNNEKREFVDWTTRVKDKLQKLLNQLIEDYK